MGRFGLCDTCVHQKLNRNTRGSVFLFCKLSRVDDGYPKYPPVPVRTCTGYTQPERKLSDG